MTSKLTNFGRVGVIYGGNSSEREISLLTGAAIVQALKNQGVETVAIDIKDQSLEAIKAANIDRAFIALHGPGGEDGTLQGALEYLGIPYTGSGLWHQHWLWISCAVSKFGKVSISRQQTLHP